MGFGMGGLGQLVDALETMQVQGYLYRNRLSTQKLSGNEVYYIA